MDVAFNLPARENAIYRQQIDEAIRNVLDSGYYLLGHEVNAFENEFAAFCGAKYCSSLANGTDALEIALRALGVVAGDEVITVANAGAYSTTACNIVAAVPVYVDVQADDLLLDIEQIKPAISTHTKCIIVTHLYGQAVDVKRVRSLLSDIDRGDIKVLEDCAQAHGATINGDKVGSHGDIACFSFYPTKNLGALGDGGAVITSDPEIHQTCLRLRQYGWEFKYCAVTPFGRNSRLDELQAAVLRIKLQYLPVLNNKRRAVCESLYQTSKSYVDVVTQPSGGNVSHLFVVRHPNRKALRALLSEHGIATDIHYPVLDSHQPCMSQIKFRQMPLAQSIKASEEIFSLPCYSGIEQSELEYIDMVFKKHIAGVVS